MKWGSWCVLAAVSAALGACGDSSSPSEDFSETQSAFVKGTTGAKVGDSDYCSTTPTGLCALGEGDCDSSTQCQPGLVCVAGNLDKRGALTGDACAPSHCGNGLKDADETSIDCGGTDCGWDCGVACDKPNGSESKCNTDCPCSVGEGDCDNAAECQPGLVCGTSNGAAFGLPAGTDACWASTCQNGSKDGNETAVDCGGSCAPCAPPAAGPVALASNRTALLNIVIAPHSDPTIHSAIVTIANDLRDKLNVIVGGATFTVTSSNVPSGISLGIDGDFPNAGWPYQGFFRPNDVLVGGYLQPERLALLEQYVLRTPQGSNRVIVAGATVDGLRDAVWDLLKQAGYRHYFQTPTWEVTPFQPSLTLAPLAIDEKPAFFARTVTFNPTWFNSTEQALHDGEAAAWRKHNRLGGQTALTPQQIYSAVITSWATRHGQPFPPVLTTTNTSTANNNQFCLSTVASLANGQQVRAVDAVREWAQLQTGMYVIPLSPNTRISWSSTTCPDATDPLYSSIANRVAAIANAAAEAAPNKVISGKLFDDVGEAPTIALRQNVFMVVERLYPSYTPFSIENRLGNWSGPAVAGGLDDNLGVSKGERPGVSIVSTQEMFDRVTSFYRQGARHYNVNMPSGWGLPGPSPWALAQLLWDADAPGTVEQYRSDFFSKAFGKAAPAARKYFDALEDHPLNSEPLLRSMYGALEEAFDASDASPLDNAPSNSSEAIQARLGDLAIYTRYLELYRKFWNRCSGSSPAAEQSELKELLQFVYATHDSTMLRAREAMGALMTDAATLCPAGNTCTNDGCQDNTMQLIGACVPPSWNTNCFLSTGPTGDCPVTSATVSVGQLRSIVHAGVAYNAVLDPALLRSFSKDLVPYTPARSTLAPYMPELYMGGPNYLYLQRPVSAGPVTVHERKYDPNTVLLGQLSSLLTGQVAGTKLSLRGEPELDWNFGVNDGGVYRYDVDEQADKVFTSFASNTRVAIPMGRTDPPLALNYRWKGYFFVPAGTDKVVGWSEADGTFFRYNKDANGNWISNPPARYLSDYAVGHACTNPHIATDTHLGKTLDDNFIIPITPPAPTDELWLFTDGGSGTVGNRVLLNVPPYLFRSPAEVLVPREVAPESTNPTSCTTNANCAPGQYCTQAGLCRSEGGTCSATSQCATGQSCQTGTCQCVTCSASCTCGVGGTCAANADCRSGLSCQAGTCQDCSNGGCLGEPCTVDAGCVSGLACSAQQCVPSCQAHPETSECIAAHCSNGVKDSTETDVDCGGGCQPCTNGAGCAQDADCGAELVCGLKLGPAFGHACGTNACVAAVCATSAGRDLCGFEGAPCGTCGAVASCPDETQCTPQCNGKVCGGNLDDGCRGRCKEICGQREPGCETDSDCVSGDACIKGGGPRLGLAAGVNVCLPTVCLRPDVSNSRCGAITATCGLCPDVPSDVCAGRVCGLDPTYGVACGPTDVPCVQGQVVRKFGPDDVVLLSAERRDKPQIAIPALPVTEPADEETAKEPGATAGQFSVDAQGSATYTVPIVVPPGRAGMQPRLSLDYNSKSGNGIVGMGWSIGGLSTIARCSKNFATDGELGQVRFDKSDALCLDGARLILSSGVQGEPGSIYRTELDSQQRVELKGGADPASTYFVVSRRDGQRWTYGRTDRERLFRQLPNQPRVARAWAVSRMQDRAGNLISFAYAKIEDVESRSYAPATSDTVEFYPVEVAYGGTENDRGSRVSRLSVKFVYQTGRPDYMEGFTSTGSRITRTMLLTHVDTYVAEQKVREYDVNHVSAPSGINPALAIAASGPSRVSDIQECTWKNGDRACLPATQLGYSEQRGFVSTTAVVDTAAAPLGPIITLDVNGDSATDYLVLEVENNFPVWAIYLGNGDSHQPSLQLGGPIALASGAAFSQSSVVDLDGDGRDELVDLSPHYALAPDRAHGKEHSYSIYRPGQESLNVPVEGLSHSNPRAFLLDANGDGLVDLMECADPDGNKSRGQVWFFAGLPDGTGFATQPSGIVPSDQMRGNCGTFAYPKPGGPSISVAPAPLTIEDVTGDGNPELLIYDVGEPSAPGESLVSTSGWFRYSVAADGTAGWTRISSDAVSTTVWNDASRFKFIDVNGDGLKDLLTLEATPQLALNEGGTFYSVGSPFAPGADADLVSRLTPYSLKNAIAVDYDGDGAEDLLRLMDPHSEPAGAGSHWLWDRANVDSTLELDRSPLNLADQNLEFLTNQPNVVLPAPPSFAFADADGDGSPDLIQRRAAGGLAITFGRFGRQNLLTTVEDGLGKRIDVRYDATSRFSDGSVEATYQAAATAGAGCAVDAETRCKSHVGGVVSQYTIVDASISPLAAPDVTFHFRYRDARAGLRGRGWLGFGQTIIDKAQASFPETPIERTEITRDNRTLVDGGYLFPFAGLETARVTTRPISQSALEKRAVAKEHETLQLWQLHNSKLGGLFPFVFRRIDASGEVFSDGSTHRAQLTQTRATDVDDYGNVRTSEMIKQAGGEVVSVTTTDTDFEQRSDEQWLINLPTRQSVTEALQGSARAASAKPDEERTFLWHYDDDGLLDYTVREPGEAENSGLYLKTEYNRFKDLAVNLDRNVRDVVETGSWLDGEQTITGRRVVSFQYDGDAIALRRVIRHVGADCPVDPTLGDLQDSGFGSTCLIDDVKLDPRDGTVLGRVSATGVGQQMSYDGFGRVRSRITADSEVQFDYDWGGARFDAEQRLIRTSLVATATNRTTGGTSTKCSDALGRVVQVESSGLDGDPVTQEMAYEWENVLARVTRPHLELDSRQGDIELSYDPGWQPLQRLFPDGTSIAYLHASAANVVDGVPMEPGEVGVSATIDQNFHAMLGFTNVRGASQRTQDGKGSVTRFTYDAFGTLNTVTDAQGHVTTTTTDKLGRPTSYEDGDSGLTVTGYTAFDQVVMRIDGAAPGQQRVTTYQYDDAGRLLTSTSPEGPTSFTYDDAPNAMGRLVRMTSPEGNVEQYDYESPPTSHDPMANRAYLRSVTREIGGASFTTGLSYDPLTNQLHQVDLPDSADGKHFSLRYAYDEVGVLKAVTGTDPDGVSEDALFWQRDTSYQGRAVATESFGNGVSTAYAYQDTTGRLQDIVTRNPDQALIGRLEYTLYDNGGNLKSRRSSFLDVGASDLEAVDETFDYDELDRLKEISIGTTSSSVTYDAIGNITERSELGTYNYSETGKTTRPHAVQNVKSSGRKVLDLEYDDFGNVTHRSGDDVEGGSQEISYNSFNLPTQVELGGGTQLHYQYDASQRRVLLDVGDCTNPTSATCNRRTYVGEAYERQTGTDQTGAYTRDVYKVFASGRQVAQVQRESRSATSTETRRFLHGDHLGSSQLTTDEQGQVASLRRFNTFGELTSASSPDAASESIRSGFTGHETDVETGLVNMRGRIYDPQLGRFLQADAPFAEPPSSQGLNRYSYVFNNPLRFTDPSGFQSCSEYDYGGACEDENYAQALANIQQWDAQLNAQAAANAHASSAAQAADAAANAAAASARGMSESAESAANAAAAQQLQPEAFTITQILHGPGTSDPFHLQPDFKIRPDWSASGAPVPPFAQLMSGGPSGGRLGGVLDRPKPIPMIGDLYTAFGDKNASDEDRSNAQAMVLVNLLTLGLGELGEAKEAIAAAEGASTDLSILRQTSAGEQFLHYGYAEQAANFEQGILPGGYATTVDGLSGVEAQSGLALPHPTPPNAVYTVSPTPGTWIQVNPTAVPKFGQPGGLPEVQFIYGTNRGTVSGPSVIR